MLKKLKERYKQIPAYLRNKYSLTFILFLVWMFFFDQNNIVSQIKLQLKLDKLQDQKAFYQKKIKEVQATKEELLNDDDKLERFAREKYWMKKPGEDLYIVVEEENN